VYWGFGKSAMANGSFAEYTADFFWFERTDKIDEAVRKRSERGLIYPPSSKPRWMAGLFEILYTTW
jgi:hypothetical protein